MAEHARVRLQRVDNPNPQTQAIFHFPNIGPGEPVMVGVGDIDLLCAGCERVVVEGVSAGQVMGIVFKCPDCGVHGRTRT